MSDRIHRQFLSLLGWQGEELDNFLPEWKCAAELLGLSEKDVSFATNEWLPQMWNLSMKSIRMLISACIREIVDLAKTEQYIKNGESVIYVNIPSVPACMHANLLAGEGKVHIAYPGYMIATVLGAFFNKSEANHFGDCAVNHCAHCKMNNFWANACISGKIATPTITWNWGIKCDEAPKTDELIQAMSGNKLKNVYITIPHDSKEGEHEAENVKRLSFLADKIRDAQRAVEQATGVTVSEEHYSQALAEYMQYMERVKTLADLVMLADPQPVTGNELSLLGLCVDMCLNVGYSYINEALDIAIEEVKERILRKESKLAAGAPRVFCQFNLLYAPWLSHAFAENGVCLQMGRMYPFVDVFREFLAEQDFFVIMAKMSLSIPSSMNMLDECRIYKNLVERYPVDAALYGFYSFDKWVGALQTSMIKELERETGIPHFYINGDLWDSEQRTAEGRMAMIRSMCTFLKISSIL